MVMEWSLIYYIVIYTDGNGVVTDILHCNISMVMEWSLIYYIVIYTDGNGVITDILHCNIY